MKRNISKAKFHTNVEIRGGERYTPKKLIKIKVFQWRKRRTGGGKGEGEGKQQYEKQEEQEPKGIFNIDKSNNQPRKH